MSKTLFGLAVLSAILPFVAADALFLECSSGYPYNDAVGKGSATSGEDCAALCTGYTYSYLFYANYCYCSSTAATAISQAVGQKNTCRQRQTFEVNLVKTSFTSTTCYDSTQAFAADGDSVLLDQVTEPKVCFDSCRNNRKAILRSLTTDDGTNWYCSCADEVDGTITDQCGRTAYYVYDHPAEATASGLARRNAREAKAKKELTFNACPGGFTACLVPGLENLEAWECVDTQNDLESCGGCLVGAYNNPKAAIGQSCVKPGAKLGAATCAAGKCVVSECKNGFKLVNNECVLRVDQAVDQVSSV